MTILTQHFTPTILQVILGLLAIVGIIKFLLACWRNIKRSSEDTEKKKRDTT